MYSKIMSLLLTVATIINFLIPVSYTDQDWRRLNLELQAELLPLEQELNLTSDPCLIAAIGDRFQTVVRSFLIRQGEDFTSPSHRYYQKKSASLSEARRIKNDLRRKALGPGGTSEDKRAWYQSVRAISQWNRVKRQNEKQRQVKAQEAFYRKSFWNFSKSACSGSLGSEQVSPTFTKEVADQYFLKYQRAHGIDINSCAAWLPEVDDKDEAFVPFDMSPITPSLVKRTLQTANKGSKGGIDGITFGLLARLPTTHKFLATLYTKTISSGFPPKSWSESTITLVFKKGSADRVSDFRMICLSSTLGKTLHLILAKRTDDYIKANSLVDPEVQKGFLKGISGVFDHTMVLGEMLQTAKREKRTIHACFLDVEDAYGSVSHQLVEEIMRRNCFPPVLREYINNFYRNSRCKVVTKQWESNIFSFRSGVQQGDPWSPLIFLLVIQPVLAFLGTQQNKGFKFGKKTINALAYCDDLTILSGNRKQMQKLLDEVNLKFTKLGLKLKWTKCRSLSVVAGNAVEVPFKLEGNAIPTCATENHSFRFLGSIVSAKGGSASAFKVVTDQLSSKLENLNACLVRQEYKIRVFKEYLLPSCRFMLTVNRLNRTQLRSLDATCNKWLKKWVGLPRSANTQVLHLKLSLNIPSIEELYLTSKALTQFSQEKEGDETVQIALKEAVQGIDIEKKLSTHSEVLAVVKGAAPDPRESLKKNKEDIKEFCQDKFQASHLRHLKGLICQGDLVCLWAEQGRDAPWKSCCFELPRNLLKFMINAGINTLPTKSNLKRWGKLSADHCRLCGGSETRWHVLNGCKVALNQGRFTYRHNCLLKLLAGVVDKNRFQVFADLPGMEAASGSTIPPYIAVTTLKPDLVIINKESKEITIYELTIPMESRIDTSHELKLAKYDNLVRDISEKHDVSYDTIEISSIGSINHRNRDTLKDMWESFTTVEGDSSFAGFLKKVTKTVCLASYFIFNARNEPIWNDTPLIEG